jgi:hypothetical protein
LIIAVISCENMGGYEGEKGHGINKTGHDMSWPNGNKKRGT